MSNLADRRAAEIHRNVRGHHGRRSRWRHRGGSTLGERSATSLAISIAEFIAFFGAFLIVELLLP